VHQEFLNLPFALDVADSAPNPAQPSRSRTSVNYLLR